MLNREPRQPAPGTTPGKLRTYFRRELMLNRHHPASGASIEVRRAVVAQLRERLRELPASPLDWQTFDPAAVLGHSDLRLANLGRLLCSAPARTAELRGLWRESVVTAAFALTLGPRLGGEAATSGLAGLLHRLGDMLTLRAIAEIEHAAHLRLDPTGKAELCATHGPEQLERAVRAWGVPARAAATAAEWRRLREFPAAAADAAAVYLARLLAVELISPDFCAPGMVELATEEVGLDPAGLSALRTDATIAAVLTSLQ
jgi:hypothetical protein